MNINCIWTRKDYSVEGTSTFPWKASGPTRSWYFSDKLSCLWKVLLKNQLLQLWKFSSQPDIVKADENFHTNQAETREIIKKWNIVPTLFWYFDSERYENWNENLFQPHRFSTWKITKCYTDWHLGHKFSRIQNKTKDNRVWRKNVRKKLSSKWWWGIFSYSSGFVLLTNEGLH